MAPIYKTQRLAKSTLSLNDQTNAANEQKAMSAGMAEGDDRFPGSFFRIPGLPSPGKTTWSLTE
jgi:hypothetical protein